MQQFSISGETRKRIQEFLKDHSVDLATAMHDDALNKELAAILHAGLPAMVRKFYGVAKMEKLFVEQRDVLIEAIGKRLNQTEARKK